MQPLTVCTRHGILIFVQLFRVQKIISEKKEWPLFENTYLVSCQTWLKYLSKSYNPCPLYLRHAYFLQIVDNPKVSFITTPSICKSKSPDLVVMVLTSPTNFKARSHVRSMIRDFNENSLHQLKPIFLMGISRTGQEYPQDTINKEGLTEGENTYFLTRSSKKLNWANEGV